MLEPAQQSGGHTRGDPPPPHRFGDRARSASRWLRRHPALLFLAWALWLGAESLVFGPNSYVRIHDNGDAHLPARIALTHTLKDGTLGFWAPQWAAGTDRLTSVLTSDLTALPFFLLSGWLAYGLVIVAQRFVAGLFTFYLLRDQSDVTEGAAIFAGLTYALFSQNHLNRDWTGFVLYYGFALPGIPLVLWLLSRFDRGHWLRGALLAFFTGAVFALSASIAMTLFTIPLFLFWFWFVSPRRTARFWMLMGCLVAGWALVTFFANLPLLRYGSLSNRAEFNPIVIWGPLQRLIGSILIMRDNVLPLALGLLGLVAAKWRDQRLNAIAIAICLCFAVSAFGDAVARQLRSVLGFLYGFNWERFHLLVPFLTVSGAAIGVSKLQAWQAELTTTDSRHGLRGATLVLWLAIPAVIAQSLSVKAGTLPEMLNGSNYRALFLNQTLQQLAQQHATELHSFRVATISLGNTDPPWPPGAVWAYGLDSADGYLNLQSLRYREFWKQVIQPLTQHDRQRFDWVHSWGGQLYLFSPTYGFPQSDAATVAPVEFEKYYRLELLTLANVRYIVSPVPLVHPDLVLLPSSLRDEQLAWTKRSRVRRLLDMLLQRAPGTHLNVYENRQRLPRAFCASSVKIYPTTQDLLLALRQATLTELASTVLLDRADAGSLPSNTGFGGNEVSEPIYSKDRVTIHVAGDSPCFLVLTDSYSPYWRSQVDSLRAQLWPADRAFRGVIVPPGNHQVTFFYSSPYRWSKE